MKKLYYLLLFPLLMMTSCVTSLKVKVSTANQDSLRVFMAKLDIVERQAYTSQAQVAPLVSSLIITERHTLFRQLVTKLKSDLENEDDIKRYSSTFQTKYMDVANAIETNFLEGTTYLSEKKHAEALSSYKKIPGLYQTLMREIEVEELLTDAQKAAVLEDSKKQLQRFNLVYYAGRANLLGDELVAYITMKDHQKIWKSVYNRTVGKTAMGNADIAVILNEMPNTYNNNYSIKGVRVDATKVIQASFDLTTQLVNLAAMSYGLPTASTDTISSYPDELPALKNADSLEVSLEQKEAQLKMAQKELVLMILNENLTTKSGDELKAATTRIKTNWETLKSKL